MSLTDTTSLDYFNRLILKTSGDFQVRAENSISDYANKILEKNNIPSFSELQNISDAAYQKVMRNGDWVTNFNSSFNLDMNGTINNQLAVGSGVLKAQHDNNNPNAVTSEVKSANVPSVVLTYPVAGADTSEKIPFMKIRGFKYKYDQGDQLGNNISSTNADGTAVPATERTATINLPLPGNLASALELEFDDYSSVFAKIVRSVGGIPDMDQMGAAMGSLKGRADNANVYGQGATIAAMSGMFAKFVGGSSNAEAASVAFSEALNYVKVAAGIAVNPMQQASYVGSKIRHHAFEFNLVPRNKTEAIEVKKIIQTLQYHSIGARIAEIGGFLTDFPSVWNVSFHTQDGTPINGILSIPDSFLTNVEVTYSPTRAGFTVTRDNDPFAYVLRLVFKESQNLIRDDLAYLRQGEELMRQEQPKVAQSPLSDASKYRDEAATRLAETMAAGLGAVKEVQAAYSKDEPAPGATPTPPKQKVTPKQQAEHNGRLKDIYADMEKEKRTVFTPNGRPIGP